MAGFHKAGPNEALIRSGGGKQPKIIVGGRLFAVPILQMVQRLDLGVSTLEVGTIQVYTKEGVQISVDGVAQVKVATNDEAIRTASTQFLGKNRAEMGVIALQTMEGHQRAILGTMTVEAIYQDREAFASAVRETASTDLANMGLEIVSYTIRNINDDHGYLDALGVKRTAEVKRDATIGEAEAERDAGIRAADADRQKQAAIYAADTKIAESERDFNLEKAAYDKEVNARKAEAELAYELQATKTKQAIREEELQIDVVERQKRIEVEREEVSRREQELEATVRRPAEAEKYRLETVAAGKKEQILAKAEAQAESKRLHGDAEADAIRARGLSEAEAMRQKAQAWKEYGQAALVEMLTTSLPAVATAIAQPLASTEKIVIISGGNSDSAGAGASKVTGDVTAIVAQVPEVIEALTGIDIVEMLKELPGIKLEHADSSE